MTTLTEQTAPAYASWSQWNAERPRVLVACCSDGRLQGAMDEFLQNHLHIRDYDRFYAPGGYEFPRATQYRDDVAFLIRVHKVEEVLRTAADLPRGRPRWAGGGTCAHPVTAVSEPH